MNYTVYHDSENLSFHLLGISDLCPDSIKNAESQKKKKKSNTWKTKFLLFQIIKGICCGTVEFVKVFAQLLHV